MPDQLSAMEAPGHSRAALFDRFGWYNPRRRHSYGKMLSPGDYDAAHRVDQLDNAA